MLRIAILFIAGLAFLDCAHKTDCRKFATAVRRNDGARLDCKFDEKTARKHCVSGGVISDYAYRSLHDFIDEGRIVGRRLVVSVLLSGATTKRTDNFLDGASRILSSAVSQDASVSVYTAQAWDGFQRTVSYSNNYDSGTGSSCNGTIESFRYDDAALTVTDQISYAASVGTGIYAGSPCFGVSDASYVYRYDSDMELIASDSYTYTILSKEEVCQ